MKKIKIKKTVLTKMKACYAVTSLRVGEKQFCLSAPDEHGVGKIIDLGTKEEELIWKEPGGTMGFIKIPGKEMEFLAVQNFFPGFDSKHAMLVWCRKTEESGWIVKPLVHVPYVHRFDIFEANGINYLLVCTLCAEKKDVDDWSHPGQVLVGVLPECPDETPVLECLLDGQFKNHGYCRTRWNGKNYALTGSESGIYKFIPPDHEAENWKVQKLSDIPVSDVAVCDIDEDGNLEYMVIRPFHGGCFEIYREYKKKFILKWKWQDEVKFGHVVWGGNLFGRPAFIGGYREKDARLFCVFYNPDSDDEFDMLILDEGQGPANIHVIHEQEAEKILAANHRAGELVLYELSL